MISDLDIYRSANVLIREHGEEAGLEALPMPSGTIASSSDAVVGRALTLALVVVT